MKYLFFDIECADGSKATICTFGYVLTDESFKILRKEDLVMNPQSAFNLTGREGKADIVLAYPHKIFKNAPTFPNFYRRIKSLVENDELFVVGHSVGDDANYLNRSCKRYKLQPLNFKFFDTQRLYKQYTGEKNQKSLENALKAVGVTEEFRSHKSDEDARATMLLMKKLLEKMNMSLGEFLAENNHCTGKTENGEIQWDYINPYSIIRKIHSAKRETSRMSTRDKNHILLRRYIEFGSPLGDESNKLSGKKITLSAKYEKKNFDQMIKLIGLIRAAGGEYTLKVSESDILVREPDGEECMRQKFLMEHSEITVEYITLQELYEMLNITKNQLEKMQMPDIEYLMDEKYGKAVAV